MAAALVTAAGALAAAKGCAVIVLCFCILIQAGKGGVMEGAGEMMMMKDWKVEIGRRGE